MPQEFATHCTIYNVDEKADQHLLFSCAPKLQIWQDALRKYVDDRTWTWMAIELLFFVQLPEIKPKEDITVVTLLGTILFTIWKYHFNWVVDEEPFTPTQVSAAIDIAVQRLIAERNDRSQPQQQTPSAPLPAELPSSGDLNFPT